MGVLGEWSLRRIRSKLHFWYQVLRTYVDWVMLLYVWLPGLALVIWGWVRFARQSALWSMVAGQQAGFGLTFRAVTAGVTIVVLALVAWTWFCRPAIALQSGDRLFLFLSPIRRSRVAGAMWLEGLAFTLPGLWLIGALLLPLERAAGMRAGDWLCFLTLAGGLEALIRLVWPLAGRGLRGWAWRWFFRVAALLPGVAAALALFGRPALGWLIFVLGGGLVAGGAIWRMTVTDWEGLFQVSRPRFAEWFLPNADAGGEVQDRIRFRFPAVPGAGIRLLEKLLRRPVHPVSWLIVLKAFRRRGLFQMLVILSIVAIHSLMVAPTSGIKLLYLAFCVLVFIQWWNLFITPLYRAALEGQGVVEVHTLNQAAARFRFRAAVSSTILWLVAWRLIDFLGGGLPILKV